MWKLVIEDDEGKRTVVPLSRDDYTIGRKEGHAIRLTERNISRNHAQITRTTNGVNGGFRVTDLSSYNGVFVNGLRLAEPQNVLHGDLIQVGDYRIILNDDNAVETPQEVDIEDVKSTVAPGRRRLAMTGQMLLKRPDRLVMLVGPTPGEEYPLDKDRITIGRAEEATISINHNSVSRLHCEIHMLSESRFEIVDKGSSNGVRVNSSDLSRGIIEAGDLIELGDVRFKFVGAGQVFIPNASDSQRTAAITDREASQLVGEPQRSSSILPFVLIGLVLGGAAVGAAYFINRMKETPTPPPHEVPVVEGPKTQQGPTDSEVLSFAFREHATNPEGAYQRIRTLPIDSPARREDNFATVANAWAENRIRRAGQDPNAVFNLTEVVNAAEVSPQLRQQAETALEAMAPHPSGTQAPTATHRTSPTSIVTTATSTTKVTAGGGDIAGSVAAANVAKNYASGRSMCKARAGAGLTDKEARECRQACKGDPDGSVPSDPACMAIVNAAPRK